MNLDKLCHHSPTWNKLGYFGNDYPFIGGVVTMFHAGASQLVYKPRIAYRYLIIYLVSLQLWIYVSLYLLVEFAFVPHCLLFTSRCFVCPLLVSYPGIYISHYLLIYPRCVSQCNPLFNQICCLNQRFVCPYYYSRWTKYSNPAARAMLNPRAPKSQCFSARVSKSDVRGLIFFVHWG